MILILACSSGVLFCFSRTSLIQSLSQTHKTQAKPTADSLSHPGKAVLQLPRHVTPASAKITSGRHRISGRAVMVEEEKAGISVKTATSKRAELSSAEKVKPVSPSPSAAQGATQTTTSKLLCVNFRGRLGNQLFQYASALGLSLTLNRTAVFLGGLLKDVLKNFHEASSPGLRNATRLEERCRTSRQVREESCCKYSERLTHLRPDDDYTLGRFLQSYRYFDRYKPQILQALTFNDDIRNKTDAIVRQLRHKFRSSTLIGVHVRRGEMAFPGLIQKGYRTTEYAGYINRSLAYFTQVFQDCVFVVASDGLKWCQNNFPEGYRVHYLHGNQAPVDMLVLSSMDHVVITLGTFSWWIGYLNTGTTVSMKDFLMPGTVVADRFRPGGKDYVYPEWVLL